jgi:hypothetical protein
LTVPVLLNVAPEPLVKIDALATDPTALVKVPLLLKVLGPTLDLGQTGAERRDLPQEPCDAGNQDGHEHLHYLAKVHHTAPLFLHLYLHLGPSNHAAIECRFPSVTGCAA